MLSRHCSVCLLLGQDPFITSVEATFAYSSLFSTNSFPERKKKKVLFLDLEVPHRRAKAPMLITTALNAFMPLGKTDAPRNMIAVVIMIVLAKKDLEAL